MIAALRDLLSRATPGKWAWDSPANWCGISDRVAPAANMGQVIATVDTSGWGKRRGNTNSALIVAAVNNLPSLLDIAEAVRAYRDAVDEREAVASADGVAGGEESGQMARLAIAETNAYRAMIGALKALETDK